MIGELKPVAFPLPKTGEAVVDGVWLVANLARVKIEKYTKLFDRIGFAYSPTPGQDPGNGEFYLPGAAAAALIGQGEAGTFAQLGAVVGADAAAIAAAELPVNPPWPLTGDPSLNGDPALSGDPSLSGDPAINGGSGLYGNDSNFDAYTTSDGTLASQVNRRNVTVGRGTLAVARGTLAVAKGTLAAAKGTLAAGQNAGGGQARSNVQRSLVIGGWLIRFADD